MEVFANNYLSEPNYSGIIPDTTDINSRIQEQKFCVLKFCRFIVNSLWGDELQSRELNIPKNINRINMRLNNLSKSYFKFLFDDYKLNQINLIFDSFKGIEN